MTNFFEGLFDCFKRRKGLFVAIIILTIFAVILGIISAINFSGGILTIDLSNIVYIRYIKGEIGFANCFFRLIFSVLIFIAIILLCNCKPFLLPISFLFYFYLVYSQVVVITSIILVYGIFNCIILVMLLILYLIATIILLSALICKVNCLCQNSCDFKNIFKKEILFLLLLILIVNFLFCLTVSILKNFVILIIY